MALVFESSSFPIFFGRQISLPAVVESHYVVSGASQVRYGFRKCWKRVRYRSITWAKCVEASRFVFPRNHPVASSH